MEISLPINLSNSGLIPNLAVRDKNKMPVKNVTKIMAQILPNDARISVGAQEMIIQSATKYINFVTRKAKERTQSEYRKTINVEDLLWAIEKLGFDEYVGPLTTFVQRNRNIEGGDLFTHYGKPIPYIDNNGLTLGLEANLVPTLEMPRPSLPPPVRLPELDISVDPNMNLEVLDPNAIDDGFYIDEFGVVP